jgi:hypothetical protein
MKKEGGSEIEVGLVNCRLAPPPTRYFYAPGDDLSKKSEGGNAIFWIKDTIIFCKVKNA